MKKLLLRTMLLLCALIAGSGTMWGGTVTLTQSSLGLTGSYTTNTEKTIDGITYVYTDLMKNSSNIQAKASSGVIYNKTAFPGNISSVAITHSGTARATTIFGSSDGTNWTQVKTGTGSITGDFSGKGYKYFKITRGSNAAYWTQIVITYSAPACATPTFSPAAGTYSSAQSVTISTETEGATIYYTTDGTTPSSSNGTAYSSAITVSTSQTIKAIAVKDGNSDSEVATASYTITSAVATTTAIDASGITNTDVYVSTTAGSFAATVKDNEDAAIAAAVVTWSSSNTDVATIDPSSGAVTLVAAGSTTITASYAGVADTYLPSSDTYELTVTSSAPQPTSVTFNMNYEWLGSSEGKNLALGDLPVVKSQDNVTVTITDGTSTRPRGDSDYIRVYVGSTISFEAPSGYDITGVTFTAGGTWNAPSVNSGTLSNKTWSGSASSVVFTLGGTCFISSAEVTLAKQKELSSIAVSGTYPTVFEVGDAFSHEGVVVTATYDDASEAVVTASAIFSTPDMSSAGVKTVTVSYTENAVEKTTTYDITVKAPAALESIALSGTYPTTFNVGDEFSHEGMIVTANFNDETNADVTSQATFTGYDMSAAGVQTVTVSYTHKGVTTKTKTYDITVNTVAVSSVTVAPTSATVKIGKTVTLTPTISPDNATNKNVTWESNNTSVATVDGGVVTGVAAGEATITVKSAADPTKSASCTITVITAGDGSKAKPYDVEEALEIISGYSSGSGSAENVYTKGIVSSVGTMYNSTMLTYFISIDGTGENTIQVFRGKNLGNTNFAATSDISVNDEVIVYGQLYKYNSTPEINTGNYIYSLNGVKIPEITFGEDSYEVVYNGSLTITATADCSGAITYSSSDETVAEINSTTGVVTPHKAGEVTITANVAVSANNIAGSKDVTLTVTDGRTPAGIAFANASVTKTWGEAFTGQELTNPNSVAITYESSDPAVATVNASTGVVTIVKAGETVIKASFAGDGDYMSAEVSYTLTVNKAAAGLSFTVTAYEFDLNDDSFTGVAVNNPNSLTVTYASSDDAIALVDENDGTLVLDASAEGTVTITASFTGNDNYNAGNASYTITITDPDRKGTKKNPYTVAEVEGQGSATEFGNNIYVTGYIVGCVKNNKCYKTTTANLMDTNLLLADSPDVSFTEGATVASNTDGLIPVELPASPSSIRTNWGVASNNVIGYKVILKGNAQAYFGTNAIKGASEISAVSVPAKVTSAEYATFASPYNLNFSTTGITVYTATDNTTYVKLNEITSGQVPANTPVVLYKDGADGTAINVPVVASADAVGENDLNVVGAGGLTGEDNIFVLAKKNSIVGFYLWDKDETLNEGKIYLQGSGALARTFLGLGDDTTGIKSMNNGQLTIDNEAVYDLQGRKVAQPTKGLYIVNGKKVVKK